MRRPIIDKLKDESGVSILYGLFFLIVALMVTGVMLAASTTAVQRLHADQEREQNTLTLSSAGNLLREYLEGISFRVSVETNTDTNLSTAEVESVEATSFEAAYRASFEIALENAVMKAAGAPLGVGQPARDPADAEGDFQIKVQDTNNAGKLGGSVVNVHYTLTKRTDGDVSDWFHFNAVLTLEGSDQQMFLSSYPTYHSIDGAPPIGENVTLEEWEYRWLAENVELKTRQE